LGSFYYFEVQRRHGKVDTSLNEKLDSVEWGDEVYLKDIFTIKRGKRLTVENRIKGDRPLVTAGYENTGVAEFIGNNNQEIFPKDTITIDMFANTFYRNYQYSADDNILVLFDKEKIPPKAKLFIVNLINKVLSRKFSYGKQYRMGSFNQTKIQLPTKNNKIDFKFMENFIAELEAERIAKLEAYLEASGLKEYDLTDDEKSVLDAFERGEIEWEEFKIDSLFEKLKLRTLKKPFDKLNDTSSILTNEFNLPLVNAKLGNNGIMFYGREEDFDIAEMTIDIISNGAIATGTVYAQPYKTGILWDAYLVRPKVENISTQKLLFFTTSLEKSIKTKFGWDNKAVWSKVQHEVISLPTKNKKPNYELMQTLISAIQKLVIKDVVLYVDGKIKKE